MTESIRPLGSIDVATLTELAAADRIRTVIVGFPDAYGRVMGTRVTASFFLDDVLGRGTWVSTYLLACDIGMAAVDGYTFASWETGYGDIRLIPDIRTLRLASWLDRTAIVLCDAYDAGGHRAIDIAPRSVLRRQVERATELGLRPLVASELELYICADSYENAARKHYLDLDPAGSHNHGYDILQTASQEPLVATIRDHLDRSGIPVEASKGEWGPGQEEINLRCTDILEMADRHTLLKHATKEIAIQHGQSVTFMAAWDARHMGSGLHLHVSVSDAAGRPLFPGDERLGPMCCSSAFRWFLGGWMAHLREVFAFYAPYPNSYKRFVPYSTATNNVWSVDHRSVAFRVVGHDASLRIECRVPGADANPYLAFAATLAAGLDGLEQRIEPPPMFEGDPHVTRALPSFPRTLTEAAADLEGSAWARRAFGDEVVSHYLHFCRTEQRLHDEAVTDWDRARYFERI